MKAILIIQNSVKARLKNPLLRVRSETIGIFGRIEVESAERSVAEYPDFYDIKEMAFNKGNKLSIYMQRPHLCLSC